MHISLDCQIGGKTKYHIGCIFINNIERLTNKSKFVKINKKKIDHRNANDISFISRIHLALYRSFLGYLFL